MKKSPLSKRLNETIQSLNEAIKALHWFSQDISILAPMQELSTELAQAVEVFLEELEQASAGDLPAIIESSELIVLLTDLQDNDHVSELESLLLEALDTPQNPLMATFIGEIVEKLDRQYTHLLQQAQTLLTLTSNAN